jgi:integrative and conjugative element protein (TIGR02256 family)
MIERIADLPARPWEVGGWLLGYSDSEEGAIVLTHATPPSRGTPFSIRISGRHHRRYFDQAWSASGGHVTFLGDWHTHPGGVPMPSDRDEEAMRQIAADPNFGEGPNLIAIAATGRWRRSACVETRFYVLEGGEPYRLHPRLIDRLPPPADRVPAWRWPG